MTIAQIYRKYHINQTLQQHMFNVAAVGLWVVDHWTEAQLDRNLIATSLLLHDIGNLVKFNLKKYADLLGEDRKDVKKWIKLQKKFIKKYGKNAHKAGDKILEELKIGPEVKKITSLLGPAGLLEVSKSHNWHYKIAYYADARVAPHGLVSLKERFDDLHKRYAHQSEWQAKATEERYKMCVNLEQQLQKHCSTILIKLEAKDLEKHFAKLKVYQIN